MAPLGGKGKEELTHGRRTEHERQKAEQEKGLFSNMIGNVHQTGNSGNGRPVRGPGHMMGNQSKPVSSHTSAGKPAGNPTVNSRPTGNTVNGRPVNGAGYGHPMGNNGNGRPVNGPGYGYPTGNASQQKPASGSILDVLSDLFDDNTTANPYNHGNASGRPNGYGSQGHGNYGRPTPPPPPHPQHYYQTQQQPTLFDIFGDNRTQQQAKPQKNGSILGALVEGAVASMLVGKMTSELNEAMQAQMEKAEEASKIEEEEISVASTPVQEEDLSAEEGYPSFCPGCGAPTIGKRYCEYCGTKVF